MVLWPSRDLLHSNTELLVKTSRRLSYSRTMKIVEIFKKYNLSLKFLDSDSWERELMKINED